MNTTSAVRRRAGSLPGTVDGHEPGDNRGVDPDAQGNGVVIDHRLYLLLRQKGAVFDRVFTIEFEDPGVQAFSFTFG